MCSAPKTVMFRAGQMRERARERERDGAVRMRETERERERATERERERDWERERERESGYKCGFAGEPIHALPLFPAVTRIFQVLRGPVDNCDVKT